LLGWFVSGREGAARLPAGDAAAHGGWPVSSLAAAWRACPGIVFLPGQSVALH